METVEVLYYKWCLTSALYSDYIYIKTTEGMIMVYCRVEKVLISNEEQADNVLIINRYVTRTVPVKREEMEKI